VKWFRFYNEVLDDPKVQQLTPELFKFWVNILCIASKNEGKLPSIEAISYHVRASVSATQCLIDALLEARLIQELSNQHTTWLAPHAWQKRQYKSDTSNERVKRYRNAQRNDIVTPPDTDTDTEQNKEKGKKENAAEAATPKKVNSKGTRLSEEWELPDDWGEWCINEFGWTVEKIIGVSDKFKDHWIAVSGSKGVKLSWLATWRNWCRRDYEGAFK